MAQKITSVQQNNAVTTYTNPHADGGTFYYVNLGGLKILWGRTNSKTVGANSTVNFTVTMPSGFFTTVHTATSSAINLGTVAEQYSNVAGANASSMNGYVRNPIGTSGSSQVSFVAIGV